MELDNQKIEKETTIEFKVGELNEDQKCKRK
ncbi:MAG: hypothetical protein Ct9H90mP2_05380 [Dehalococcoidia bacterium]|nr:MAG: hypothetical protein Ct9H90mP2_05380 [Dehalococcoidia bacterium]